MSTTPTTPSEAPSESPEQEWHYTDSTGQQLGPISADQLQQLANEGTINASTQVWTDGLDEWAPASQVEGLLPSTPSQPHPQPGQQPAQHAESQPEHQPEHQPQINLGSGGINLGSTITAQPMGQSLTTPYSQKSSNTGKWVMGGIAALVAGIGIYFAATSGSDPASDEVPGLAEYIEANDRVSARAEDSVLGNGTEALKIGKNFLHAIYQPSEPKSAEGVATSGDDQMTDGSEVGDDNSTDGGETADEPATETQKPKIKLALHCHALNQDGTKTVALLVKVPDWHNLEAKKQKELTQKFWLTAKQALANTPYSDAKTQLALGIRGATTYHEVLLGHPLITGTSDPSKLEGVDKSYRGAKSEEKLYPFFIKKK